MCDRSFESKMKNQERVKEAFLSQVYVIFCSQPESKLK